MISYHEKWFYTLALESSGVLTCALLPLFTSRAPASVSYALYNPVTIRCSQHMFSVYHISSQGIFVHSRLTKKCGDPIDVFIPYSCEKYDLTARLLCRLDSTSCKFEEINIFYIDSTISKQFHVFIKYIYFLTYRLAYGGTITSSTLSCRKGLH